MNLRAAGAALAVSFCFSASAHAQDATPVRRWISANEALIAGTKDPRQKHARQRAFEQSLRILKNEIGAPARIAAGDAQARAAKILADHSVFRFGEVQKAARKTWWDQLRDWVSARWTAILKALFGHVRLSGEVSVAIGDVLLLASIVAFLLLLLRAALQYGGPGTSTRGATPVQAPQDPEVFYARATAAAADGRFSTAVAELFSAALLVAEHSGWLAGERSETVGQLRRQVRGSCPKMSPAFDVLASILTMAVYADVPVESGDWTRAQSAFEQLRVSDERTRAA